MYKIPAHLEVHEWYMSHLAWLGYDVGDIEKKRANLENANLYNANLYNANLENANLKNANLKHANLENANLENANLENANLYNANLKHANLKHANLENANLYNANLKHANLENANLYNANLKHANLNTFQKWAVTWEISGVVRIGCKAKTVSEWDDWFAGDMEFDTARGTADFERIEAAYQHARRMYEIWLKYDGGVDDEQ